MAENDQRTQSNETPSEAEETVDEAVESETDGSPEETDESSPGEDSNRDESVIDDPGRPEDPGVYVPDYANEEASEEVVPSDSLFLSPDDSESELVEVISEVIEDDEAQQKLIEEFEQRIESVEGERDDFKNRMMRVAADLENFRKRAAREKEELRKFGIDRVVLELLPVIDNLERALAHAVEKDDDGGVVDGVRMVYKQFVAALEKHGVKGFESKGDMFDPQKHEAIQQIETPDHDTNTVLDQYQKGYWLHERLIRPALVSVAKRIDVADNDGSDDEESAGAASDTPDEAVDAATEDSESRDDSAESGSARDPENDIEGAAEPTELLDDAEDETDDEQ